MSSFSGIDFDSNEIHVCTIDEETLLPVAAASYDLAVGPGDAFARARRIRDLLPTRSAWVDLGILAVGLEDVYSRHLSSVIPHKRVEGALVACLPREIEVYSIRPQHWKMAALGEGHGNADKPEIRAWAAEQNPGLADWPQGLIDAFAIARATATQFGNDTAAMRRRERGAT